MKNILSILSLQLLFVCLVTSASASSYTGTIYSVACKATENICNIDIGVGNAGNRIGAPPCGGGQYFTFDTSSGVFDSQFSIALAAQASGANVHIDGSGECLGGIAEGVDWIHITK